MDSKKEKYETFIRKLLQKPSLRGSDLLYTFLSTEEDFTELLVNSTPVGQELGNIYLSVAHKLRKEKGQNLDSFMNAFLASTGKSKQGCRFTLNYCHFKSDNFYYRRFGWAEFGDEIDALSADLSRPEPTPKTYRNYIFNDNFGVKYENLKDGSSSSLNPVGITGCLFYLCKLKTCTKEYKLIGVF